MSSSSTQAYVKPSLLRWGRESAGLTIEETAKRLKLSSQTIQNWEYGEGNPGVAELRKLARVCKRPLAAFLLPRPPEEPPPPEDFRTLPADQKTPFSQGTLLAIRRARRIQALAKEVSQETERAGPSSVERDELTHHPEAVGIRAREQLGIDVATQLAWGDENVALAEWIKAVEKQGILVLQLGFPLRDGRAFSLPDERFPAIILNIRDSTNGRIFSLFHEYAHLLIGDSGICDMRDRDAGGAPEFASIEVHCNHFAGAMLVPRSVLLESEPVKSGPGAIEWSDDVLRQLARGFCVSQEVVLRRLLIFGRTTQDYYEEKRREWQARAEGAAQKKPRGKPNPPKRCLRQNGSPFVSLVLSAHSRGDITYLDIADYLGIRLKYIPTLEQLASGTD